MAGTDVTHDAHSGGRQDADDNGHGPAVGHDADAQEPLGPVDWAAWRAGILGAGAAGMIAVALYLSANPGP